MSVMTHTRSKTPNGLRHRSIEGVNPYEPVVTSLHFEDIIRNGRSAIVKRIVQATSRNGRESTVLFVDEIVEGRRVLDKFRLCCITNNGAQIDTEGALASIKPYRIERLDGANYWHVYIDQRAYDTRACCGMIDLTWSHFFVLCGLTVFGASLVLYAVATAEKDNWLVRLMAYEHPGLSSITQ